jgi:two-component system NtrC family response regulator
MSKVKLLIVEDDEGIRSQLKYALRDEFMLWFAEDRTEAMTIFHEIHPSLVSLDLGLPPSPDNAEEGLKALDDMLNADPATKVVVLTGNDERENAVRAVQLGAFDYQAKPIDLDHFKHVLQRAAYLHGLEAESELRRQANEAAHRFEDILGSTPKMREIFAMATRVAKTDATVLLQGESGTGKELLARAIHNNSTRRTGPFVPINCGAIPETLLESELFGHEKGAYTGAHIQRKGKIEVAEGGTLFLDEIGEMSLLLQVKLLRFLQEREIERIGGRERIRVDVRIIAASNKDLMAEIQGGRFREDLYYRLSVVTVKVPPLRDRGEDILLLANAFLRRNCHERRRKVRFSKDALQAMLGHSWPGNIRELENKVQRAVIMAQGRWVEPQDLELEAAEPPDTNATLREIRSKAEHQALIDALLKHRGNISQAAKELKVSRPTLHGLLEKFQVNAREFR